MNKILFIGCGHMGSALLTSWYKNTSNYFTIVDPNQYKKINKKFRKRCHSYKDMESLKDIKKFDIIIFAVKPQIAHLVLSSKEEDKITLFTTASLNLTDLKF